MLAPKKAGDIELIRRDPMCHWGFTGISKIQMGKSNVAPFWRLCMRNMMCGDVVRLSSRTMRPAVAGSCPDASVDAFQYFRRCSVKWHRKSQSLLAHGAADPAQHLSSTGHTTAASGISPTPPPATSNLPTATPPSAVAPSTTTTARTIGIDEMQTLNAKIEKGEAEPDEFKQELALPGKSEAERLAIRADITGLRAQITALTNRLSAATLAQPAPPEMANSMTVETLRSIDARATVTIHAHRFGKLRRSLLTCRLIQGTLAGRIVPLRLKEDPMRVFADRVSDLCNVPLGTDKSLIPHMAVAGIGGMSRRQSVYRRKRSDGHPFDMC